jgi:hypothetical protein
MQFSTIINHFKLQNEGEWNSSYCFYNRCQTAARINWTAKEKSSKGIFVLSLLGGTLMSSFSIEVIQRNRQAKFVPKSSEIAQLFATFPIGSPKKVLLRMPPDSSSRRS